MTKNFTSVQQKEANQVLLSNLDELNIMFKPLSFEDRIKKLFDLFDEDQIVYTCSFGASAVLLLYLMKKSQPGHKVHFLDTTYHFDETKAYKHFLTKEYNLNLVEILPDAEANKLTREKKMWESDPDQCCDINKVQPLKSIKDHHDIWISGLMGFQNASRAGLGIFHEQKGIVKFSPLVDIFEAEFLYYMNLYKLIQHPLLAEGYESIGCTHCTSCGEGRSGRWNGTGKTECGLHF